jgi:hypothetical protein
VVYTREFFVGLAARSGYRATELGETSMPFEVFWRLDQI